MCAHVRAKPAAHDGALGHAHDWRAVAIGAGRRQGDTKGPLQIISPPMLLVVCQTGLNASTAAFSHFLLRAKLIQIVYR